MFHPVSEAFPSSSLSAPRSTAASVSSAVSREFSTPDKPSPDSFTHCVSSSHPPRRSAKIRAAYSAMALRDSTRLAGEPHPPSGASATFFDISSAFLKFCSSLAAAAAAAPGLCSIATSTAPLCRSSDHRSCSCTASLHAAHALFSAASATPAPCHQRSHR